MAGSINGDQRKLTDVEDSNAMTIEFLRARLLSERSVSRTARQRADELAKRVLELEEQLRIVTLQRKKAEKATADVLAILENHGLSDFSETFDSSSDQEGMTVRESKVGDKATKDGENCKELKAGRNEVEDFSGSEHDSSSLPGRSLSWRSNGSAYSHERKYTGSSARRHGSFSSIGSSPKHRTGKSCRQIKHRETRLTNKEAKIDPGLDSQGNEIASPLEYPSNCCDDEAQNCTVASQNQEDDATLKVLESAADYLERQRKVTGKICYLNGHGKDEEMERVLEQQAQLIGQYEAEEKAQREWEEKFKENNGGTPDSCEPGNQSDVTEERDEIKMQETHSSEAIAFQDQQAETKPEDFTKMSRSHFMSEETVANVDMGQHDHKSQSTVAHESSSNPELKLSGQEKSDRVAEGKQKVDRPKEHSVHQPSLGLSHPPLPHHHSNGSPGNQSTRSLSPSRARHSFHEGEASESRDELQAQMPHKAPKQLNTVLEALQKARLSLKHEINKVPLIEGPPAMKRLEPTLAVRYPQLAKIPIGCPELFRVPTDFPFGTASSADTLSSGPQLDLRSPYPDVRVAALKMYDSQQDQLVSSDFDYALRSQLGMELFLIQSTSRQ
ncbi:hypothetical protein RJ641_036402 [Dillenia turbinata]|uniref:Uncharacterized protein n=1 Tax=Dillenia turbinata TaxID=194707 RepID=A0AAN8VT59_9MAGN